MHGGILVLYAGNAEIIKHVKGSGVVIREPEDKPGSTGWLTHRDESMIRAMIKLVNILNK